MASAFAVELQCSCGDAGGWHLPPGADTKTLESLRPHLDSGRMGDFRAAHVGHVVTVSLHVVRICTKCGHPACPHCGNWCDKLVPVKVDGDAEAVDEPEEVEPCCDMECTYDDEPDGDIDVVLTAVV